MVLTKALRLWVGPSARSFATSSSRSANEFIKIVEVGPRDGLQNEKTSIPTSVKVDLINRLGQSGLSVIESGSFVSPKWVPQMAGTADVLKQINHMPNASYSVLVPNAKGLETLLALLSTSSSTTSNPLTDEIAVFVAASESFSKANINCSIAESLSRLEPVVREAQENGLRVRGYVSTVITCPYEGKIIPEKVKDVVKALDQLGCYEISLGDTVGTGTPVTVEQMLDKVMQVVPAKKLAAHVSQGPSFGP
ncbi:hypothetical protein FRB94_010247 [Tulasnella sp. JGI-2019a]|nr:hypothetical protein FRB94_010247 [Tulasnella sp. JGI-2019a]